MGYLDDLKKLEGEAVHLVEKHKGEIEKGIRKAAGLIDERTGRKHSSTIDKVEGQAESLVEKLGAPKSSKQSPAPKQQS